MRQVQIFSGSSHPALVDGICDRLGQTPGQAELRKFSNGETSVQIQTSIRNSDVFIVQSGSSKINDNVMELLIMISACKGGSAKSITAVMPYFPYSRQSKKKSHRGAITARMIANLLAVAGVDHVVTIDLHATQMQGFFQCPVDNLVAEPLIARWIKQNVKDWQNAVVVSKNPGGTKRVTSLADALKLSFGIVTTDRRRPKVHSTDFSLNGSMIFERFANGGSRSDEGDEEDDQVDQEPTPMAHPEAQNNEQKEEQLSSDIPTSETKSSRRRNLGPSGSALRRSHTNSELASRPLAKSALPGNSPKQSPSIEPLQRVATAPAAPEDAQNADGDEFTDEAYFGKQRARDVIHGRLVYGHIVDDDSPSPAFSARSHNTYRGTAPASEDDPPDQMMASWMSTASSFRHGDQRHSADQEALGGSADAAATSDEEEEDLKNPDVDTTVTLVGNVRDRPVFIVDDMIDKPGSWIAAAETVVKRGGATKVYCIATHGLFGGDALEEMQECECIEKIITTNSFPLEVEKGITTNKLIQLDIAPLLSEAIRRNHNGESISQLFMHFND
ncbi:phosphoribosyl pyrophosphokinase [Tothia fuscella]|uniref:Ribose-phosphate pyrophosphokinase 1 n=1 Tax=Tothia fuscella TaxID=1048955 RepID=A0A9P4P209_9PEZI|nr:phosphoribosyl pyrophosphokinase [Tothia fuscella]